MLRVSRGGEPAAHSDPKQANDDKDGEQADGDGPGNDLLASAGGGRHPLSSAINSSVRWMRLWRALHELECGLDSDCDEDDEDGRAGKRQGDLGETGGEKERERKRRRKETCMPSSMPLCMLP